MNQRHLELCSSAEWAEHIEKTVLPWATGGVDLGDHLLEVGPGPGHTTNVLRTKVPRLTAVEIDSMLAANLVERFPDSNVEVVNADASELPFPDDHFSAAASFTMLHHVPTIDLQNRILSEIARVLRPGGVLVGSDSLDSPSFRDLHVDDICNPIDPLTFEPRLRAAGFTEVSLQVWSIGVRFFARV